MFLYFTTPFHHVVSLLKYLFFVHFFLFFTTKIAQHNTHTAHNIHNTQPHKSIQYSQKQNITLHHITSHHISHLFGAHCRGHGVCFRPSRGGAKKPELAKLLCENSGTDVEWLIDKFNLDLSIVARLGGHSAPRTHCGKERFPGVTTTYALIQMAENIVGKSDEARIMTKARVTELIMSGGACLMNVWISARKTKLLSRQQLTR